MDFHGGPRAAWIALLGGARLKIGHAIKSKGFLYHRTTPRRGLDSPLHSVETHAGLVRALGADFRKEDIPPLILPPARPEEIARVEALTAAVASGQAGPGGGPSPSSFFTSAPATPSGTGARKTRPSWLPVFSKSGDFLAAVGGEGDRPREDRIAARLGSPRFLSLSGRLNMIEVRELVRRAVLFIGPDSGPMHLAAGTATPIIAYFGPTLPALFGPWRPGPQPGENGDSRDESGLPALPPARLRTGGLPVPAEHISRRSTCRRPAVSSFLVRLPPSLPAEDPAA